MLTDQLTLSVKNVPICPIEYKPVVTFKIGLVLSFCKFNTLFYISNFNLKKIIIRHL